MLAHHLAAVNLLARLHEEAAAVEQLIHRISHGLPRLERHERTVGAHFNLTLERLVILETVCHHRFALGGRQQVAAKPHQAAGRNLEFEQGAVTAGLHMDERPLAAG